MLAGVMPARRRKRTFFPVTLRRWASSSRRWIAIVVPSHSCKSSATHHTIGVRAAHADGLSRPLGRKLEAPEQTEMDTSAYLLRDGTERRFARSPLSLSKGE